MDEGNTRTGRLSHLLLAPFVGIGVGFLFGLADVLTRSLPLSPFAALAAPFYGGVGLLFGIGGAVAALLFVRKRPLPFLIVGTVLAFPGAAIFLDAVFERLPHGLAPSTILAAAGAFLLWLFATMLLARLLRLVPSPALVALPLVASVAAIVLVAAGSPVRRADVDAEPAAGRPNVLLILIDTLRADHLGLYGYPRATSPALARLAGDGVQFAEAYAQCSWTKPSVVSLLASRYPFAFSRNDLYHRVPESAHLLAEIFAESGYRTGAIVANPVVAPVFGFAQGFESYDHGYLSLSALRIYRYLVWLDLLAHPRLLYRADYLARSALDWIREGDDEEPFFLYLHFMDPHEAYDPGAPYDRLFRSGRPLEDRKTLIYPRPEALPFDRASANPYGDAGLAEMVDRYDGEVRRVDDGIGAVVDGLRRRGLYESTVVAVVADHGEEFLDHGGWGHGQSLYGELTRVPLVLKKAGDAERRGVVDTNPVMLVDLAPTLLALAGLAAPAEMDGTDLFGSRAARPVVADVSAGNARILSVRHGPMHLVRAARGDETAAELFHIGEDPGERTDRAGAEPGAVLTLMDLLDSLIASTAPMAAEEADLSEETIEQLRGLGYLQ